jgi:hypothetical protein
MKTTAKRTAALYTRKTMAGVTRPPHAHLHRTKLCQDTSLDSCVVVVVVFVVVVVVVFVVIVVVVVVVVVAVAVYFFVYGACVRVCFARLCSCVFWRW